MKLPPFKVDGRTGSLRWLDAEGRPRGQSGRVGYLMRCFGQAVIAGVGRDFEIRLGDGPWHRIEATADEAREMFTGLGGAAIVLRASRIRAAREERGLPVIGETFSPRT